RRENRGHAMGGGERRLRFTDGGGQAADYLERSRRANDRKGVTGKVSGDRPGEGARGQVLDGAGAGERADLLSQRRRRVGVFGRAEIGRREGRNVNRRQFLAAAGATPIALTVAPYVRA